MCLARIHSDQTRDADRNVRALQLHHPLLQLDSRSASTRERSRTYSAHDPITKRSTKRPSSSRSRNTPPGAGAVATPGRLDRMDRAQERLAILRSDPILDLNQHRAVVGQRLDRDGELGQLHTGRHVGLVAERDAHAPVEQRAATASLRRRRPARCACLVRLRASPRSRCPPPGSPASRPGSSPPRAPAPRPARSFACRPTGSRAR